MKNFLCTLAFNLLFVGLSAQNAIPLLPDVDDQPPMTMGDCVRYALEHNPNLASIQLSEMANRHQIAAVKATALPQLNATGQYLYNYALPQQLLPGEVFGQPGTTIPVKFGVANNMTGMLELQQLLYSKSYRTGLEAAEASQSLVALNTFQTKEELVYNVVAIYLQIQITEKQKEILQANLDRLDQLLSIAQIQFSEGLIKKIDVDQLRVNRTNLQTELQSVELGAAQQLNLLKFYMGMAPEEDLSIGEYLNEGDDYPLYDNLRLQENTSLRLLDLRIALNQLESDNARAGYYPTLSAFVRYGWQGQTDKLFSNNDLYDIQGSANGVIGLNLQVPIFDGFQKRHEIQQLEVEQNQLHLNREYLSNSIRMEFANANETLEQNKRLLSTQEENMQLAEELYNVTKLSYQEGVAPLTELLN
ncbi:MAG: TolC family protein, partial [Lewinella sp.]|nr:TolC family protein [Lewinella sp.]